MPQVIRCVLNDTWKLLLEAEIGGNRGDWLLHQSYNCRPKTLPWRFILQRRVMKSAVLTFAGLMIFACQGIAQDDGQTVYKQKCAMCHGPNGEGKIGPALKGTKVGEDDIVLMLGKGKEGKKAPHTKAISGLTDAQIKTVAHYVKSLK